MKILMLNEVAAPEGGEMNHYVFDVANRLRAEGHQVALVHGRKVKSAYRGTGYIYDHLQRLHAPREEARIRLLAIVDDFRPDIVQIHGAENLYLDEWLREQVPVVRWVHNHRLYCSGSKMTHLFPRRCCRRAHGKGCLFSHAVRGCGSTNLFKNWMRYRTVSRALALLRTGVRLQVSGRMMQENLVRNGIAAEQIERIPLYAAPASDLRGPAMNPRRFLLHPGGLVPHKGVWTLVRHLRDLPEDVDLVFAGAGGALEQPLKNYVARQGLGNRVKIMGNVTPEQWSYLFSQAALVALPYTWNEPLGLAGLYAMANGKTVVAFQGTGMDEWLEPGVTGEAVPWGDRKRFIATLGELLSQPKRLQQLGANALERWKQHYRPEIHLQRLVGYYCRVLEAHA